MKTILPHVINVAFLGLLAIANGAAPANAPAYYPPGSVDAEAVIGPPPAVDSAEFREQMAIVLWLQKTRTPEQVEFVRRDLNLERFTTLLSDELLAVNGAALARVLNTVIDEVQTESDAVKEKYGLPRPSIENREVKPALDSAGDVSYPSGYAIRATVWARLLGDIFPTKAAALMELGKQIGYGRAIAGIHYPIDVVAGQKLGNAYADVILKQPAYREAITAALKP